MNAETGDWEPDMTDAEFASMGPRSHERGNLTRKPIAATVLIRLQWGRVLMNAETSQLGRLEGESDMLQWGRVLMNAETRPNGVSSGLQLGCFNGAAFS